MAKLHTLGQAVKDIQNNNINNSYLLYGDDILLQDFFIKQLKLNKKNAQTFLYYLGYDDPKNIINELSNLSLFSQEKILIIKNITRFSTKFKNEIINHISNLESNNYIIFVKNNFDSKNKFISNLQSKCITIDVRTPFENKMVDWIKYICKIEKISISVNEISNYINAYGSNLSNVMNYIKIDFLSNEFFNKAINRNYFLWNLQDSIGKKELVKSIDIYDSLIQNGNNVTLINIYMFSLFEAIYNYKSRFNESPFNFALNKIIKNRINNYALKFNIKEIERIILKINENDYLIKSTNLDIITLSKCMISNICKGYYE